MLYKDSMFLLDTSPFFDRSLVESGPRNSFVVVVVVCHFVCHSLKFLSISSSFSFRQVSTCFQNHVKSFQQVWTCFKNCIKSYHTILTSLDMFVESYQIILTSLDMFVELHQIIPYYFDKSGHVCRIVSNRIILFQQVWTCFQNHVKFWYFKPNYSISPCCAIGML